MLISPSKDPANNRTTDLPSVAVALLTRLPLCLYLIMRIARGLIVT